MNTKVVIDRSLIAWRAVAYVGGKITAASVAPTVLAETYGRLPPLDGDIYLGRVRRMAPEVGGCFIDLGVGEQALMPIEKKGDQVTEGASVIVQVTRAARGSKGPRVGRHITLAGRYKDYSALVDHAGRLNAPCPIWVTEPQMRVLSDVITKDTTEIICPPDIENTLAILVAEMGHDAQLTPLREAGGPFVALGLEDQIAQALATRVDLPGGGFLLIEPTAALVAIDVNAGADQRGWSQVNREAASEIARQIILRDLGGRIAIDFIAGRDSPDLRPLVVEMAKPLTQGGAPCRVIGPSALGLVEIERRRRDRGIIGDVPHFADQTLRAAERLAMTQPGRAIRITAGQSVFDWFQARTNLMTAIATQLGRAPQWVMDPGLKPSETRIEDYAP